MLYELLGRSRKECRSVYVNAGCKFVPSQLIKLVERLMVAIRRRLTLGCCFFSVTNRVLELVGCQVIFCRSSVQDDVDYDASRRGRVQIPNHRVVCESVCYESDQLLDKNKQSETRCTGGAGMRVYSG